jgi:hypothetical protein
LSNLAKIGYYKFADERAVRVPGGHANGARGECGDPERPLNLAPILRVDESAGQNQNVNRQQPHREPHREHSDEDYYSYQFTRDV